MFTREEANQVLGLFTHESFELDLIKARELENEKLINIDSDPDWEPKGENLGLVPDGYKEIHYLYLPDEIFPFAIITDIGFYNISYDEPFGNGRMIKDYTGEHASDVVLCEIRANGKKYILTGEVIDITNPSESDLDNIKPGFYKIKLNENFGGHELTVKVLSSFTDRDPRNTRMIVISDVDSDYMEVLYWNGGWKFNRDLVDSIDDWLEWYNYDQPEPYN